MWRAWLSKKLLILAGLNSLSLMRQLRRESICSTMSLTGVSSWRSARSVLIRLSLPDSSSQWLMPATLAFRPTMGDNFSVIRLTRKMRAKSCKGERGRILGSIATRRSRFWSMRLIANAWSARSRPNRKRRSVSKRTRIHPESKSQTKSQLLLKNLKKKVKVKSSYN